MIESSAEGNFLNRCFASSLCLTLGCHGLRWGCTADFWGFAWFWFPRGMLNHLGVPKLAEWVFNKMVRVPLFFSYRSFFFKIPSMLGLGALGTLTLWWNSLKFSIQNNKSCVWKQRAFWFFLRPELDVFQKRWGSVFSWYHICNFQFAHISWNGPGKLDVLIKVISLFKLSLRQDQEVL